MFVLPVQRDPLEGFASFLPPPSPSKTQPHSGHASHDHAHHERTSLTYTARGARLPAPAPVSCFVALFSRASSRTHMGNPLTSPTTNAHKQHHRALAPRITHAPRHNPRQPRISFRGLFPFLCPDAHTPSQHTLLPAWVPPSGHPFPRSTPHTTRTHCAHSSPPCLPSHDPASHTYGPPCVSCPSRARAQASAPRHATPAPTCTIRPAFPPPITGFASGTRNCPRHPHTHSHHQHHAAAFLLIMISLHQHIYSASLALPALPWHHTQRE